jgi:hypothetical protein
MGSIDMNGYWFTSSLFQIEPGEDAEINPQRNRSCGIVLLWPKFPGGDVCFRSPDPTLPLPYRSSTRISVQSWRGLLKSISSKSRSPVDAHGARK